MSRYVPRTLEALLLHALPPAAAELLTQKLEHADVAAVETGTLFVSVWLHHNYWSSADVHRAHTQANIVPCFGKTPLDPGACTSLNCTQDV